MIPVMGNGNGGMDFYMPADPLWWVIGGTIATVVLYNVLKKPAPESATPVGVLETPEFKDMNAVAVRFGQIRDLWSMGYIGPEEAVGELKNLASAILDLQKSGKTSPGSAQDMASRMEKMIKDIIDYHQMSVL